MKTNDIEKEAKAFLLNETALHPKNWKGNTTEKWMALFVKFKLDQILRRLERDEERVRKLEGKMLTVEEVEKL